MKQIFMSCAVEVREADVVSKIRVFWDVVWASVSRHLKGSWCLHFQGVQALSYVTVPAFQFSSSKFLCSFKNCSFQLLDLLFHLWHNWIASSSLLLRWLASSFFHIISKLQLLMLETLFCRLICIMKCTFISRILASWSIIDFCIDSWK